MTIFDPSNEAHIHHLCQCALKAGTNAMRYFGTTIEVQHKKDHSPLTRADQEGETILTQALNSSYPYMQIIGEEEASLRLPAKIEDEFFLLDALDGTKAFINKQKNFTINIAFIQKTKPIAGIIYAPAMGELFFTHHNKAYELAIDANHITLQLDKAKEIKADLYPDEEKGLIVMASHSHHSPKINALVEKLQAQKLIQISSSRKFCLLARGDAHIYPRYGQTMEWDIAAGHALLLKAGGTLNILNEAKNHLSETKNHKNEHHKNENHKDENHKVKTHKDEGGAMIYGKLEKGLCNPPFIAKAKTDFKI